MRGGDTIKRVLMTGLATGFGSIKPEKCARQTILAVQHFRQPVLERPRWIQIIDRENEIVDTVEGGTDGFGQVSADVLLRILIPALVVHTRGSLLQNLLVSFIRPDLNSEDSVVHQSS
jgi:hypothetical protein